MVSAISRLVKLGSSITMFYDVAAVFGRPLQDSSSTLLRPRLNFKTHLTTIGNDRFF